MKFLNTNLNYLRKVFSVSQATLASEVNKGQTTIGNWENKVSEPSVDELITISNFFGITLDDLILTDLSKGNLITEEHVSIFKQKGNLKGNPLGKLKGQSQPVYSTSVEAPTMANEPDPNMQFAIVSILRQMDGKLDLVRDSVNDIKKKIK